ncbi:MAG: hypothetical protein IIT68_01435 [Treponema sp.]|nr:hypothetical protein [Treponema sp.]
MTQNQWNAFCNFKEQMKSLCDEWGLLKDKLYPLQKAASKKDTPEYPLQTAVVYNQAYDSITINDDIRLIVIGDNPGKDEQLEKNRRYLVGQSGKIADGFFHRKPELNIDFRKNTIIVNKTPVHTAKTAHLKYLSKNGDEQIQKLLLESQIQMAQLTATLHQQLLSGTDCPQNTPQLWLVGYAELKGKGIFLPYRDALRNSYSTEAWDNVFVYQHFSMNRFLIDLRSYCAQNPQLTLSQALYALGHLHRDEIFIV